VAKPTRAEPVLSGIASTTSLTNRSIRLQLSVDDDNNDDERASWSSLSGHS